MSGGSSVTRAAPLSQTRSVAFTIGEDDSPIVNATLLACDNGAALVTELPPDTEDEAGGPMPTAEVYCITSQSFFDVIRCGDALMAFPTSPALRDADEA